MNFNKAFIGGRLTRDPELKNVGQDLTVCSFGVAANRKRGDKDKVLFIDCTAWRKTAEVIAKYLKKGDPIFLEGHLDLEQWDSKTGEKRSRIKLVVDSFQFCGGASSSTASPGREISATKDKDGNIPF